MVASRPDLDLRRRAPDADPRQGQRADRALGVLVRAHRRDRPQPPRSRSTDGVPDEARGRAHGGAQARDAAGRVRRARLHHRLGLEGLPARPARSAGSRCPAGLRESERLPEPLFTPATKADVGHDEAIDFEGAVELIGDRALAERVRDVSIARLRARRRARARARDHPRRHEVRARARRRRHADARRRGAARPTPRASGPPTATSPGAAQPSFDKQFVRDWASSTGWDRKPPAPRDPRRRRRAHAREVRRGLRADHRRAVRRVAARAPARRLPDARAGPRPAQGGDPRSPGPGGGAGAAGARLRRRAATSTSGG